MHLTKECNFWIFVIFRFLYIFLDNRRAAIYMLRYFLLRGTGTAGSDAPRLRDATNAGTVATTAIDARLTPSVAAYLRDSTGAAGSATATDAKLAPSPFDAHLTPRYIKSSGCKEIPTVGPE